MGKEKSMQYDARKTNRRLQILVLAMIVFVSLMGRGEAKRFEFADHGFALELPNQWVQIPGEVFAEKMSALQRAFAKNGRDAEIGYDFGLQLESTHWFAYPYILGSIWEDVRVDSERIQKMNTRLTQNLKKGQPGVENNRLIHSGYDPSKHVYTAEVRFDLSGTTMVLMKTVYYMNKGILVLSTYMPQKMYSAQKPEMVRALHNVHLDDKNVYRPDSDQGWSFQRNILPYMNIVIATGIVLLIVGIYLWRRRSGRS
jgi:hypothetical protein